MAATEAIAVALGFAYVVLAIRQRRECWIAGGASTALYIWVFARAGLPLQAALQVFYVVLAVYGWRQWQPGGERPTRPRSWPLARNLIALAAVGAVSLASATIVSRFGLSAAPLADSLGTWASVVATWLLARRYLENWLWWIVVDVGLAALFASRGLDFTAALYLTFAALAVVGWRSWRRSMSQTEDPRVPALIAELGLDRPTVTALDGGPVNRVHRLRDARNDLVLRLAGPAASELGADHGCESAMQRQAAAHGLAPGIVLAQPQQGVLVTRHVAGRMLTRADLSDAATLRRVGAWIARLHALAPPPRPAVDFGARAAGYLERIGARADGTFAARLARELASRRAALAAPARLASCHHDLHHRNLLETADGLVAIDWEYSGPGDPAADFASCIGYHDLDRRHAAALFAGYGDESSELRARVDALGWIFACLWFGWNEVASQAGLAIDRREQARLVARLTG